jgi:phenylalanyl-tRNA synthetase alpha subunit
MLGPRNLRPVGSPERDGGNLHDDRLIPSRISIEHTELHRVDDRRILRYDLTLPLLLNVRHEDQPLRIWPPARRTAAARSTRRIEAFHQAEVLCVDEHGRLDPWRITGHVLQSVNLLLPGRAVKIVPTKYARCSEAWELAVEDDGGWFEVLAWGIFTDRIVRHLGGDPERHTAVGVGHDLERLAMLRYGIDDIRKIEAARVA